MKRILCFTCLVTLSLCACHKDKDKDKDPKENTATEKPGKTTTSDTNTDTHNNNNNNNNGLSCPVGFAGPKCDECVSGYFGSTCQKCGECGKGRCNDTKAGDGSCTCNPGFGGAACDSCLPGFYGPTCQECPNCGAGKCADTITGQGTCSCPEGFMGSRCEKCAPGYYGTECKKCPDCPSGVCSDTMAGDGTCSTCDEGFSGAECNICQSGYFGENCEKCPDCGHGHCDDTKDGLGVCLCDEGYTGANCDLCKANFFGPTCKECTCKHGTCDDGADGNGECRWHSCHEGYTGTNCDTCDTDYTLKDGLCVRVPPCNEVTFSYDSGANTPQTVSLAGDWLGCNNWVECPLTMVPDSDGLWKVTATIPSSGRHFYKFIINRSIPEERWWVHDYNNPNQAGDGFGGINSFLDVCPECNAAHNGKNCQECSKGYYDADCLPCTCENGTCNDGLTGSGYCTCQDGFGGQNCDSCKSGYTAQPNGTCTYGPCNVITFTYPDNGEESVAVGGDFLGCENWGDCLKPMAKEGSLWKVTIIIPSSGKHIYKYNINNEKDNWTHDQTNPNTENDGFGGLNNVINVCPECDISRVGAGCLECSKGYYGSFCEKCSCNGGCDDGVSGSGNCDSCPEGKTGPGCNKCQSGYFGENCEKCTCQNGYCKDTLSGDGTCSSCLSGFAGDNCDECESGHFGPTCTACNCQHGVCKGGLAGDGSCSFCNTGWEGSNCDQCQSGYFGKNCQKCTCQNGYCNDSLLGDGTCTKCFEGFGGPNCDISITETVQDQDGNSYRAVKIGTQTWMAENYRRNIGTNFHANGKESNDAVYGLLYRWDDTAADNFCPTGWHMPTAEEWQTLAGFVEADLANTHVGSAFIALIAKNIPWRNYDNWGADSYGFAAYPAGSHNIGIYGDFGSDAYFWSKSDSSGLAKYYHLGGNKFDTGVVSKVMAFSVRCVKN